ncbi:type VI secretion system lipoprotein TssJ [Paracoccus sp. Z118]|uniref:type VI secretion system lipoprotein TssJ n=1 Tax=Paracoccus sp. Z118 TaxID=2851017 RepID=UPI001C2BD1F8|nr:type VI secretion system lipoprotein TssJ [Paracoccus sp. Z118]MBV0890896.1 type VI secretion system lipoprotein TssJ [Paracoccus sp. Z118]
MTDRRTVLMGGAALGLLALSGCGGKEPPPATATIAAAASAGMNPGPDGADRPLTLTVLQLRGTGAFNAADFFALQAPETALGGDLVSASQIVLAPGASASTTLQLDPATTALGIYAGFRDPTGRVFRALVPVAAGASLNLTVGVSATGVTATAA